VFANRYTAFIDACSLFGALKRNLLLSFAQAEFYRVRWSGPVLDEVEKSLADLFTERGHPAPDAEAARQRARMEEAFPEALVADFDQFLPMCADLPDRGDHHVLAAALKAQAFALVTENLKHFPRSVLDPLNVEPRSTDDFLADTIALDRELAIAAIRKMRLRFKMPEMTTAEPLLVLMEAQGLIHTVDELRAHVHSL